MTKVPRNSSRDPRSWVIELFHEAAQRIPAYRHFLEDAGVDPKGIQSPDDLGRIPVMRKDNYLTRFSLVDLLWDGSYDEAHVISMSSGSTGTPFYWPRGRHSEIESAMQHDAMLTEFGTRERATLCVVSFAMGTWIAGTYTLEALTRLAGDGHRLTVICPGIDIAENVRILRDLSPQFEQTILLGYPPLVKEVVDTARSKGVGLAQRRMRFIVAGEAISEGWRAYLLNLAGVPYGELGLLSIYGTADAGIVGFESPVSLTFRSLFARNEQLRESFFPHLGYVPTIVECDETIRYVEEVDGEIVFSARNTLPLIRYSIGDRGRVITRNSAQAALREAGLDASKSQSKFTRPMVAVYGRPDIAASFFSVNIYPENVKAGLEVGSFADALSGKFLLITEEAHVGARPHLRLRVELRPGVSESTNGLTTRVQRAVVESMRATNIEYKRLHQELGAEAEPVVELVPHDTPAFRPGVKHRWTGER